VASSGALWVLGIGIGFFTVFGFASWSAVPARVCKVDHEHIGTATGLMLSLAAVGGFFIPIAFGHRATHELRYRLGLPCDRVVCLRLRRAGRAQPRNKPAPRPRPRI
jgi:nitrate/nitrite transporter NarK